MLAAMKLASACLAVIGASSLMAGNLEVRYNQPAKSWEKEAQPVGNGRLGAMVFGKLGKEQIQFNEITMWTGDGNPSGKYTDQGFGAYQALGDLWIETEDVEFKNVTDYQRLLNLNDGLHRTTWSKGKQHFEREIFASHADDVIVLRYRSDQPVSGRLSLQGAHDETSHSGVDSLSFSAELSNGLKYAAKVKVTQLGGKLVKEGDTLAFKGVKELTLLLAATTDYEMSPGRGFRSGKKPTKQVDRMLGELSGKNYDTLRSDHVKEFSALMGRVALELGPAPEGDIAARMDAYRKGGDDPALEALMYQYGRYLLLSTSLKSLPANLQGLWNNRNNPAWHSDYHTNINLQMNYWQAEPANLAECARPLHLWLQAMVPGSREATLKSFGKETPGWTMRTSVNSYGGNGWQWNLPASAWLSRHLWEYYQFTGDEQFLRNEAWPIFRDVSAFWLHHLIEKDGMLLVPKGWSPEHGPREDGVAHDQQIVWDLFTFTLEAASQIEAKDAIIGKIAQAREKLLGPQIGSWGQLMEWTTERPNLEKSGHRHTSHLFAVYPGNQITLAGTPKLAKAAAKSLEARGSSGDSRRSWTWAWRSALWARLGEADRAQSMVRGLLSHNTHPNLFTTHPPFQIDGNLGITAGMCEMLLQSHAEEISILPGLPKAWPSGSYRGLRARGGIGVDARWKDGKLVSASIRPDSNGTLRLRVPDGTGPVTVKQADGKSQVFKTTVFEIEGARGIEYTITRE